jgi:glycerol-3-phosphate O-acyltransferase
VLEDRTLLLDATPEARRPGALRAALNTLRFGLRNLRLMALARWHRFGYACVSFGSPMSMRDYLAARRLDLSRLDKDERAPHLARLGEELMAAIGRVIPVVPVPLVATVFVHQLDEARGEPLSELEVKARVYRQISSLATAGAHVYVPRRDQDYAIEAGLRMLVLRHLVVEDNGLFTPRAEEARLLRYYASSIAHFTAGAVSAAA